MAALLSSGAMDNTSSALAYFPAQWCNVVTAATLQCYRSAAKGIAALVSSGVVDGTPAALAAFLREHEAELNKTQV